ncbi:MAG: rod shape-determining protein MreC [Elusimicrobiaceae bacterium]|nr:rod shape-determining protein MreC [Elusimicrobiaceae bacterium]MBP5617353.1 rod shape-determining protein MreC [Elusimicrobiaceae bacterium]
MIFSKVKNSTYTKASNWYRQFGLPAGFLLLSFLLMILPLEGFISSVKAVLAYVFIPQVRAAHSVSQYAQGVSHTVQELLQAHQENAQLKQEIETAHLLSAQAQDIFAENARLTELLQLKTSFPWKGVWAKVAYREPTQWNTVVIDKGSAHGIQERSAVIAAQDGKEGLAGVVIEVTESTAKVLLVRDEDFSAAVRLESGDEGLLVGDGPRAVQIKYIPLLAQVKKGDKVYTSSSSSVFPAGILVGEVSAVHERDSFLTALTVQVAPLIRSSAVQEVFIILDKGAH